MRIMKDLPNNLANLFRVQDHQFLPYESKYHMHNQNCLYVAAESLDLFQVYSNHTMPSSKALKINCLYFKKYYIYINIIYKILYFINLKERINFLPKMFLDLCCHSINYNFLNRNWFHIYYKQCVQHHNLKYFLLFRIIYIQFRLFLYH